MRSHMNSQICSVLVEIFEQGSQMLPRNHGSAAFEVDGNRLLEEEMRTLAAASSHFTKGSPLGDTLSLSCEASVGTSGSNN